LFIDADSAIATYAASVGIAAKNLTDAQKEAAIFLAIQSKVNDSFSNVDLSVKTVSESFQQFRTAVGNVGEAIAIALTKIFGPAISGLLQKFSESLGNLANSVLAEFGSKTEQAAAKQALFTASLNDEIEKLDELKRIQSEQVGISLSGIGTRIIAQEKLVQKLRDQEEREDTLRMKQQQAVDSLKGNESAKAELSAKDIARAEALKVAQQGLFDQTRALEIANLDAKIANTAAVEEIDAFTDEKKLLALEQNQAALDALDRKFKEQGLTGTAAHTAATKALVEKGALDIAQIQINADKLKQSNAEKLRQKELADQAAFFSAATTLQSSKSKELAAIGKAAAVTEIAIKTPQAVASSFAFGTSIGGPVVGFILAAIAGIAMAAQAANVAGVGLATGITAVPGGFPNDSFPANLTSGERVLSVEQNKDLGKFLDSQEEGGSGDMQETNGILSSIASRLNALENTIIVNIGPREIMREVREGIRSGQQVAV